MTDQSRKMAETKLFGKSLKAYEDINLDELLATLTEEEIETLGNELIDPDDSCIPPSERCRYKTDKAPTGAFNRKQLLDFIEKKAKEEKDWDEAKPFKKEIRGKIWQAKHEQISLNDDPADDTEWDEILGTATDEELVDLAAILGFHGMLNQVQYHQAFVENKEILGGGGFESVAGHENFKSFTDDPPNETDVGAALQALKDNDPKTKVINLNNIKTVGQDMLLDFAKALKSNTVLEELHLANTRASNKVAKTIADSLRENKTLKTLNLESNYIGGEGIVAVLDAVNVHRVLTEFRVVNQRPAVLGNKVEVHIADLLRDNLTMLKLGIFLETPGPRVAVQEYIKRNNDNVRKGRVGQELWEAPPPREKHRKWLDENAAARAAASEVAKQEEAAKQAAAPAKEEKKAEKEEEEEEDSDEDSDEDETESSEEEEE